MKHNGDNMAMKYQARYTKDHIKNEWIVLWFIIGLEEDMSTHWILSKTALERFQGSTSRLK